MPDHARQDVVIVEDHLAGFLPNEQFRHVEIPAGEDVVRGRGEFERQPQGLFRGSVAVNFPEILSGVECRRGSMQQNDLPSLFDQTVGHLRFPGTGKIRDEDHQSRRRFPRAISSRFLVQKVLGLSVFSRLELPQDPAADLPQGLGEAGTALWTRKVADLEAPWRFDERELALLTEAGRTADDIAALDESIAAEGRMVEGSRGQPVLHGGVTEVRQLRALQLRLLSALTLTDPQDDAASGTPAQERGRRAANVRHSKTRRRSVKNG